MITSSTQKGFTIIELIVSVTIFAFMTAFLVSRYGNFNQSVLLNNLAYDVALTIRNAQTYGLNVKSRPTGTAGFSTDYNYAYGVFFDKANPTKMIFFADTVNNWQYTPGAGIEEKIAEYRLRNGSYISNICTGTDETNCTTLPTSLEIIFKRPNPEAHFTGDSATIKYVELTIALPSGQTKKVVVRKTGQIAVLQNR